MVNEQAFEPAEMSPHSQDAEEALLGSILINRDAYSEVVHLIHKDDFFILRNSWIWEAMSRIVDRSEVLEYVTVIEELRRQNRLNDAGGAAYITYLAANIATSMNAEAYATIIHTAAMRRRMLKTASEIAELAREEDANLDEVLARAQGSLDSVTNRVVKNDWVHVGDLANDYFDRIQERYINRTLSFGIKTGLIDLDNRLRGFHPGRLYIIGARPGMGKTWFMLHCALEAARQNKRVGIVSMEMGREELINRIISLMTKVNARNIDEGDMTEPQWKLFVDAMAKFEQLDIFIDDSGFQTPRTLKAKAKRLYARHGLDILFVDYLQLGNADDRGDDYQRVSAFSRACANLTKPDALGIPVITVAQLNRGVEQRQDKRPVMSDLRESGQIEQDASVIMFLYRDYEYNPETPTPRECEIIVAKNRHNGGKSGKGTTRVYYDVDNPRFENLETMRIKTDANTGLPTIEKAGQS